MRILRALVGAAVPASVVIVALLNASAVSAFVEGTMSANLEVPGATSVAANAEAIAGDYAKRASADAILDRNPFDHVTGSLRPSGSGPDLPLAPLDLNPRTAPVCEGVRPLVLVMGDDQTAAFASLDVGGQRLLRKRGGEVGDKHVAYVGRDRVWLEGSNGLCQALLFGAPPPPRKDEKITADPKPGAQSPLEIEVGKQIARVGPNDYVIERAAVDRILEAQAELMKQRIVQDKEGDRVVGVKVYGIKAGSVLSMLGIENGDRLETLNGFEMSNPEKMLEAYARLRSGAEKLQIHLTRNGKPINVDYTIR